MRWSICLFLISCITAVASAQQRGSMDAFRAEQNAQKRALQDQTDFRQSAKITLLKPVPSEPRSGSVSMSDLVPDAECYIEDWQMQVLSVVNSNEMILDGGADILVWLEGFPTANFVNDQKVRILGPIKVTGSKSYTDTEGAKVKVRTVRLLSLDEIAVIAKREADEAESKQYRKFTDSSGKHSFEGKFIEYKNSMVVLVRKDNQKTIEVKMSQLSKEDGEWLRAEMKSRKEKADSEKKSRSKK